MKKLLVIGCLLVSQLSYASQEPFLDLEMRRDVSQQDVQQNVHRRGCCTSKIKYISAASVAGVIGMTMLLYAAEDYSYENDKGDYCSTDKMSSNRMNSALAAMFILPISGALYAKAFSLEE